MMNSPQVAIPAEPVRKKELLHAVYGVYTSWVERFPLACRKGCNTCCTQSVHMTSLEGEIILDFLKGAGLDNWLLEKLASIAPGKGGQAVTMNQFAGACLKYQDIRGEPGGNWDFTPCFILEEGICSIYEARPFGCRSFGSFVECNADRAAEILPIQLAVNTVFTQIIEHIDSDGGTWAKIGDMLHSLTGSNRVFAGRTCLLQARPLPGFLLDDHELHVVNSLLRQLYQESGEKQTFGDLIDNFMSI